MTADQPKKFSVPIRNMDIGKSLRTKLKEL